MSKPRLLVSASTYPRWRGDPEPGFVHELARRLVDHFDVTVLCPHAPGARSREQMDGVEIIRYRYAPVRWQRLVHDGGIGTNLQRMPWQWLFVPAFLIAQAWTLAHLVRAIRPDVMHVHWLIPQATCLRMLRAAGLRIPPILLTCHGADLFSFRGPWAIRLKRWSTAAVDAATVVSRGMQPALEHLGMAADRISVEPMGVDLDERFTPGRDRIEGAKDVLFVGRLVEKKGLRHLLDAMPQVLQAHPTARLRIAGFGPEEAVCRARARTLGIDHQVEFLGAVPQQDLPGLYRSAAVLAAPFVESASGDQEGLGLVVIEAVGCGCPVVVGRVQATEDLLHLTGGAVRSVDARDPRILARAVIDVLEDTGRARADAARARAAALRRLAWPRVAGRYRELLDGLRAAG